MDDILDMEHDERHMWIEEISKINKKINESGTANVGAKCPSCGQEFQVDIGTGAAALGE